LIPYYRQTWKEIGYINFCGLWEASGVGKASLGANIPGDMERNARCTVLEEVFGKLLSFLGLNRSCLRHCGTSVSLAWAQDSLERGRLG
jgi:hypothetical protein